VVGEIEARVEKEIDGRLPGPVGSLVIYPHGRYGFRGIAKTMFRRYRTRSILRLSLMVSQAFLYNAIFFT